MTEMIRGAQLRIIFLYWLGVMPFSFLNSLVK